MIKTYQNLQLGFELDVPKNWLFPREEAIETLFGEAVVFYCGPAENFNIEIGQSFSESLEQIEREFRRYTLGRQYTGLEFGRIAVTGARETQISIIEHNMVGSEKGLY